MVEEPQDWFVGKDGARSGPFTESEVRRLAATGRLDPADLVWRQGLADWVPAASIPGLFAVAARRSAAELANPYAAPGVNDVGFDGLAGGSAGPAVAYADFWPRVGAALLDGLFVGLMNCVPVFGLAIVFTAAAGEDPQSAQAAGLIANGCGQLLGVLIGAVYFVTLETSAKQGTWGKQIVGIRVTDLEGRRISVGRALGRYFAKFLSGCTFGIAYLMPLFTDRRQTLHDMIAGCLALKR